MTDMTSSGHQNPLRKEQSKEDKEFPREERKSLLLRLFESEFFTEWLLLTYLYRNQSAGVQDYLCNKLFTMNDESVDRYLSQLCLLAAQRPGSPLDRTLMELAHRSLRLAVRTYWLLRAIADDHPENQHVQILRDRVRHAAMTGRWRPPFRRPVRPLTAPTAAHGAFAPQPLGLAGLGLSLGVRPASARPALRTPSQISGTSTPPIPEGPEDGGAPQAPAASAVAAAAAGSGCGIPAHLNFPGRIRSFTIQRDSTGSQSLAERVVEQQGMLLGVGGAGMSRVGSAMRLQDAEDAQSTVRHSPAHSRVPSGCTTPRTGPLFWAEGEALSIGLHDDASIDLEVSPAKASPYAPAAAAANARSHSPDRAPLHPLSVPSETPQPSSSSSQSPPALPDLISPARMRQTTLHNTLDYVEALALASDSLKNRRHDERLRLLQGALDRMNHEIEGASEQGFSVILPMFTASERVLRMPPADSALLSSRDKAPYVMCVEVLTHEVEDPADPAARRGNGRSFCENDPATSFSFEGRPGSGGGAGDESGAHQSLFAGLSEVPRESLDGEGEGEGEDGALPTSSGYECYSGYSPSRTLDFARESRALSPERDLPTSAGPRGSFDRGGADGNRSAGGATTSPVNGSFLWRWTKLLRRGFPGPSGAAGSGAGGQGVPSGGGLDSLSGFAQAPMSVSSRTGLSTPDPYDSRPSTPASSQHSSYPHGMQSSRPSLDSVGSFDPTLLGRDSSSSVARLQHPVEAAALGSMVTPPAQAAPMQSAPAPRPATADPTAGAANGLRPRTSPSPLGVAAFAWGLHAHEGSNGNGNGNGIGPAAATTDGASPRSLATAVQKPPRPPSTLERVASDVPREGSAAPTPRSYGDSVASNGGVAEGWRGPDRGMTPAGPGPSSARLGAPLIGGGRSQHSRVDQALRALRGEKPLVEVKIEVLADPSDSEYSDSGSEYDPDEAGTGASDDEDRAARNSGLSSRILCALGLCTTLPRRRHRPPQTRPATAAAVPRGGGGPYVRVRLQVGGGLDLRITSPKRDRRRIPSMEAINMMAQEHKLLRAPPPPPLAHYAPPPSLSIPCSASFSDLTLTPTAPSLLQPNGPDWRRRKEAAVRVFGELWEDKVRRARRRSPYGHLPTWALRQVIVKSGDDCRQELLAAQLLRQFHDIFREENLPLFVRPFEVLVISGRSALIECIADAVSIHHVKARTPPGAGMASLRDHFTLMYGLDTPDCLRARRNFVESMAAYSVICYLLQVKDRHNANLLLDAEGHVLHIDFGFMLSNSPGGVNFESAPFKLTRELLEVMGVDQTGRPTDSHELFDYFKVLCIEGFLAARKHSERILLLIEMMKDSGCPCFEGGPRALAQLRKRFHLGLTEDQSIQLVLGLISDSMDNWRSRQYDAYQRVLNGIL